MVSGNRPDHKPSRRRIALVLQYDGTAFNGWQVQNDGRTVQTELENALKILTGSPVRVVASGRTDSGVHAICQVVHFDTYAELPLKRIAIGLNGIMSTDVSVENAYHVKDDFNARFDPVCREYLYTIYNHGLRNPLSRNRAMWEHDPIDVEYMKQAASYLIGEHDFASFCKTSSARDINTVRTIYSIDIENEEHYIYVTIRGNAFLHNMIRTIVGTILDMYGRGDDPSKMVDILNGRDRRISGENVPAYGLCLNRVEYDPPLSSYPSAF